MTKTGELGRYTGLRVRPGRRLTRVSTCLVPGTRSRTGC